MPSDSPAPAARPRGTVATLLDPLTGFIVWSAHFLVVYCANAFACARGIGTASAASQSTFRSFLVFVTCIAVILIGLHAARAWARSGPDRGFLARLVLGCDAVAAIAVVVQLVPLFLLHLCR